jgi:hypothetical protein
MSTNGRVSIVERLAVIVQSLTLQNVLVFAILITLAIPAYGVWQLLHDSELRREIMSYAKEMDMNVPCQVIVYSFSGQNEKSAVISGVQVVGPHEIVIGTRQPGQMSAEEASSTCKQLLDLGSKLRFVLQQDDAKKK